MSKKSNNLKKDNHYVAQFYLKNWADDENKVHRYRLLVQHENIPAWTHSSVKGIAYRKGLFTRVISGVEQDDIENWFEREFESPAKIPIQHAITGATLTPEDWRHIVRYLAMQDVRTPARLLDHLRFAEKNIPKVMDEVLVELKNKLEKNQVGEDAFPIKDITQPKEFPLRLSTQDDGESETVRLKVETIPGRGTWHHSIKHLLENTAKVLHEHRWTIMRPYGDYSWPTTDNPVLKLNFFDEQNYDFGGGWGKKGTEIFLPLGPKHLLFTKIGSRPPMRGTRFDLQTTQLVRRYLVENAHREIFSNHVDNEIPKLRPRKVDATLRTDEEREWENWDETQSNIEKKLW